MVKTAADLNDDKRVAQYGEAVLKREPDNAQVLEYVSTALVRMGGKDHAERGLAHIRHLEELIDAAYGGTQASIHGGRDQARRKDEGDRMKAKALLLEARAQGLLEHSDAAIRQAKASYTVFPSVEAAREASRWLSAAGKDREALDYLASAFAIAGLHAAEPDSAKDRDRLAELYRKVNGSDTGLGDVVLKAYDNTLTQFAARRDQLRQLDPNNQIKDPMQFTLSGLNGDSLKLSSLAGKVLVLDFWATWCGPCRVQHPLYEEVKERFQANPDVVFLSVATDEDHALVKPFLEGQKWAQKVYFEDGLQGLLQIGSIPTTVIFGKRGEVASRMVGFLPDRFVDMLTDRIDEALGLPPRAKSTPKAVIQ